MNVNPAINLPRRLESWHLNVAIGTLLTLWALVDVAGAEPWGRSRQALVLIAVALATGPQALRSRWPWATVGLTATGGVLLLLLGTNLTGLPAAVMVSGLLSFYTVMLLLPRLVAWGTVAACGMVLFLLDRAVGNYSGVGLLVMAPLSGLVIAALVADLRRSRTEITRVKSDNLETLREQAAMAERARIAREMHDIVAHSISMVAVQAETASYTLSDLDDRTKQEFAEIAMTARTTLTEMRRLLGVLRADSAAAPENAPQPGLAQLPALIEQHAGAVDLGVVDLDVVGDARPLPQAVDVSVYRIVQEALTNARVHAPGARVSIELAYQPTVLSLRIADDGPGPSGDTDAGHGLVGMRERALGLGGWFEAGPGPGGGFLIQAGLPLE